MKVSLLAALMALALPVLAANDEKSGWTELFNGKDLTGWKASEKPGTFEVQDGQIVVHGNRSHLFYDGPVHNHDWKNFELKAEILTKPGSNSGVYFHTEFQETGWPDKGYEIQVNNSHTDKKRTAGIYDIKDNFDQVAKDDEWFTMTIRVEGKHIVTMVNDKVVEDYTEEEPPVRTKAHPLRIVTHGTFALQGHDPKSEVHYRSIKVRELPDAPAK